MLTALSIRDIVLIDRLDIVLEPGLTALTGETGAGKSILLDALGLALGGRGDGGLVRTGATRGSVAASFSLARTHAAFRLLEDQAIETEGEIVLRRVQNAEGSSRAFVNDQPVSVTLLRQLGSLLAEIHGQHDDRALVDVANHRRLLDAFGGLEAEVARVAVSHGAWQKAERALAEQRARLDKAEAERAFLEHSVRELAALKPRPGEDRVLAEERQLMMNSEQFAAAVSEATDALDGDGTLSARINAALRKLERRREQAGGRLDEACDALDRTLREMGEARSALAEAARAFQFDPAVLERAEERLFALRGLARKHKVEVDALADLLARFEADLAAIDDGGARVARLSAEESAARAAFLAAARALSTARKAAARRLEEAVLAELGPLKLERARFSPLVEADEARGSSSGIDRVEFMAAANPGTPLSPLVKVASGGELSRFMLALKVVLAAKGSAPVLIFDEIDTGVGGAVSDAVGQRLARLSRSLQVLAVTHSPQVASRADQHLQISKAPVIDDGRERMATRLLRLHGETRREEIARMLSGAQVTQEARAQAERLIAGAG